MSLASSTFSNEVALTHRWLPPAKHLAHVLENSHCVEFFCQLHFHFSDQNPKKNLFFFVNKFDVIPSPTSSGSHRLNQTCSLGWSVTSQRRLETWVMRRWQADIIFLFSKTFLSWNTAGYLCDCSLQMLTKAWRKSELWQQKVFKLSLWRCLRAISARSRPIYVTSSDTVTRGKTRVISLLQLFHSKIKSLLVMNFTATALEFRVTFIKVFINIANVDLQEVVLA